MRESQAFFALPLESKLSYSRGVQKIQGYSAFGREVLETDDIIEAKESFDVHCIDEHAVDSQELKDEANTFPDKEIPEFRPKVKNLATQAIRLAQRLLGALAKDLGVDSASFVRQVMPFGFLVKEYPIRSYSFAIGLTRECYPTRMPHPSVCSTIPL